MNAQQRSPLNVLRIEDCTLHAVPVDGGVEFHVVTSDGLQAVIAPVELKETATFIQETQEVLTGNPAHIHQAGQRLMKRHMTRQPATAQTNPPAAAQAKA